MDPNNYSTVEEFVKGMFKVGEKVKELNPDYIIAPMMGAVPLVDVLNIIDSGFDINQVEYMPASNKLHDVRKVIRGWFDSFLGETFDPHGLTIVGIDEVVSGNSVVRAYKQIKAAIDTKIEDEVHRQLANYDGKFLEEQGEEYRKKLRQELSEKLKYFSVGAKDSKGVLNPEYQKLAESGIAIPIDVGSIVTMDRCEFFPAEYKREDDETGKPVFYPVIEKFDVSPEYLDFLHTVASIVGRNSEQVGMANMYRILKSSRHVPDSLKGHQ